jgi:hypothetical protein
MAWLIGDLVAGMLQKIASHGILLT